MSKDSTLASLKRTRGLVKQGQADIAQTVSEARAEGATWEEIGDALGITKQGAHYRFAAAGEPVG